MRFPRAAGRAARTFEGGGEAGAEIQKEGELWKLGVSARFSSQPTITYAPLQGEKFAQQLLSPLRVETLMLLYRSGWPLKRVLSLCVQRLGRAENAVRASGPTPAVAPPFQEFARAAELIADLNRRGEMDLVYETAPDAGDPVRIVMLLSREAAARPQTAELLGLLGLAPGRARYPVTYQVVEPAAAGGLDHLEVETRSLLGVLSFLAQAVEAPEADAKAGRVTVTRTAAGDVFDWTGVTRELMRVRSAPAAPRRAAARVRYRDAWFYIDDSDLGSKSTFALLAQLVALQSGEVARLTPVLTLPVGK